MRFIALSAIAVLALSACSGPASSSGSPTAGASSAPPASASATATATPAALPTLTRQARLDGFSGAAGVVAAGDAVWVLDHSAATLFRIDPKTNKVTATVSLGSGFANGLGLAGGRLWTFNQSAGEVIAVDPASAKIVDRVTLGHDGDWFFVGDDAAWLITDGKLARIDGATAKVVSKPLAGDCDATGVVAGGGFVWIATSDGRLCQIDEQTAALKASGETGSAGGGMAFVDGALWLGAAAGGMLIVDPATLSVTTEVPAPQGGTFEGSPYTLGSPGSDNDVIVANADGKSGWVRFNGATIGHVRLDGDPRIVLYAGLPVDALPGGVVEAFDSLWVTNFGDHSVERYALPGPPG